MTTTTRRKLLNAVLALTMAGTAAALRAETIIVTTAAELEAALTPANAGKRIVVRAGEYDLSQALTVPDDAVLVGDGEMEFDGSGLPTGFAVLESETSSRSWARRRPSSGTTTGFDPIPPAEFFTE